VKPARTPPGPSSGKNLAAFIFFLLALTMILARPAGAQTVYTTAATADPLEDEGHSPRAAAMGGAFTAVPADADSLFYNPAGLSGLPLPEISLVHQDWIAGLSQETLLAALPSGETGAFALGVNYLDFGTLPGYDASGNPAAASHPFRGSLSFGWGGSLLPGFSFGLSARAVNETLTSTLSDFSAAFQTGVLYSLFPELRLGASYALLNSGYSPDAGLLTAGAAFSPELWAGHPSLILADYTLPLYNVAQLRVGMEQDFLGLLSARLGYQFDLQGNDITGFRGFTGGMGFHLAGFDLDYSYAPDGGLGFSQMIGLTYSFRTETEESPAPSPAKPTPTVVRYQNPVPLPAVPVFFPAPVITPTALSTATLTPEMNPSPTATANPSVSFQPPADLSSNDKIVKVETQFQIPDNVEAQPAATPSPELEKALEAANQKMQQNPQDAGAWVGLGNLYWQAGQADNAVQCFQEAVQLRPDLTQLRDWLDRYGEIRSGGNKSSP
jgi:tetratricopeptide (TPR) repeat protein